jgi:hypothetical protein
VANYPSRSIERGDDGERRVAVSATHPLSTPEWRLRIESLVALMAVQRNNHRNHLRRIFKWVSTDENRIASREGLGIRPGDGLATRIGTRHAFKLEDNQEFHRWQRQLYN